MKEILISTLVFLSSLTGGWYEAPLIVGAPTQSARIERTILPETTSTWELGTTSKTWLRVFADTICLSADCKSAWPTSGGGGSGTVSTSTNETAGNLSYWTSNSATPALLGKVATTSVTCSGGTSCSSFTAIGPSPITISSTAGGGFNFSADTNYGQQVYSTSTPTLWFKSGVFASSTSHLVNASTTILSATTLCLTSDCRTSWPTGGSSDPEFDYGTNIFSQVSFATTSNAEINAVGTSTFAGGIEAWRQIAAPYFHATSTATSTFSGPITLTGTNDHITAHGLRSDASDGLQIHANNWTNVVVLGVGNTANSTFYGAVNIDGSTRLATSLSGLLGANSGQTYAFASSSLFGYTPLNPTRNITVAGTAAQITSSAGAQDLSADRTWTLSLPAHVTFPGNFQATNATTTNATTTSLYFTGLSNSGLGVDLSGRVYAAATSTLATISGSLALTQLASQAANTVIGNQTGSAGVPTAFSTTSLFAGGTAGNVLGWNGSAWVPTATATCVAITGSSALCDGNDATAAGAADPFTWTPNYGVTNAATSSVLWAQSGINASSTSHIASTTFAINGRVGIGISVPTEALHVSGGGETFSKFSSGSNDLWVGVQNTDYFGIGAASGDAVLYADNYLWLWGANGRTLMTPNVGIGTTSPWRALSVHGSSDLGTNALSGSFTATSTTVASVFTNASTTAFSTDYASSTLYYGAGLANCNTENMLTWTDGRFGCESDTAGAGTSAYEIATSSTIAVPQVAYFTQTSGRTTLGGAATSSLTASGVLTLSNPAAILGSAGAALTVTGGANGQILGWSGGAPTWLATTTAGTGLSYNGTSFTVNTSQNIATLSNLTTNGFVRTGGGVGTLSVQTDPCTYAMGCTGSTTAPVSQLLYGGATAYQSVATSSVTINSPLTSAGTPGAVVGGSSWILDVSTTTDSLFAGGTAGNVLMWDGTNWRAHATATCVAITGSTELCDGDDEAGAGGGWPFTPSTNFATATQATSTPLDFKVGLYASSTSQFENSTTTLATIATAWITNLFIGVDTIAEYIADTAGAMFTGNTETDITVTYDDADNTVDFVVDTLPNLTGTLDYDSGGTGTTTAPVSQLIYGGASAYQSVATSAPAVTAPITYSGTLGSFVGGAGGNFGCTSASAGVTGCLTGTDWSTFNSKLSSYDAWTHPAAGISATTTSILINNATSTITNLFSTNSTSTNATSTNFASSQIASRLARFGGTATSTFTALGWLGVGTTTPGSQIHITDGGALADYGVAQLLISNTSAAGDEGAASIVGGASGYSTLNFGDSNDENAGIIDYYHAADRFEFRTNAAATSMVLDSSGRLGLGTTTPTWLLNLASASAPQLALSAGAGSPQWTMRNAGGNLYFATTTVAGTATSSPAALTLNNAGTGLFVGTTTNASATGLAVAGTYFHSGLNTSTAGNAVCILATNEVVTAGGTTCATSSKRFKHDILSLENGLSTVMALRPVSYTRNTPSPSIPSGEEIGFIAEEVNLVEPRLVEYESDGVTPRAVNYQSFTAVLASAIQEMYEGFQSLIARVTGLEAKVEKQQQEIDELRARLEALEK